MRRNGCKIAAPLVLLAVGFTAGDQSVNCQTSTIQSKMHLCASFILGNVIQRHALWTAAAELSGSISAGRLVTRAVWVAM
jgi:hypothetical protein